MDRYGPKHLRGFTIPQLQRKLAGASLADRVTITREIDRRNREIAEASGFPHVDILDDEEIVWDETSTEAYERAMRSARVVPSRVGPTVAMSAEIRPDGTLGPWKEEPDGIPF